jgi:hypothetical protein
MASSRKISEGWLQGVGWFAAPRMMYEDPRITPTEGWVLGWLIRRAGVDGVTAPTIEDISAGTRVAQITARRTMIQLEKLGWVKRDFGPKVATGGRPPIVYRLTIPDQTMQAPGGVFDLFDKKPPEAHDLNERKDDQKGEQKGDQKAPPSLVLTRSETYKTLEKSTTPPARNGRSTTSHQAAVAYARAHPPTPTYESFCEDVRAEARARCSTPEGAWDDFLGLPRRNIPKNLWGIQSEMMMAAADDAKRRAGAELAEEKRRVFPPRPRSGVVRMGQLAGGRA